MITIHSHPSSFPPSIDDLIANYENDYSLGIIVCHNEYEAQIMAIKDLASKFEIMFKEVTTL